MKFIIKSIHKEILDGLSNNESLRQISRKTKRSHSTIIRDIRNLEKYGYVSKITRSNQNYYNITFLGIKILKEYWDERKILMGYMDNAPPDEIRLHRLQIKYDLVNKINPAIIYFNDFPSKIIDMNNWNKNIISFEDFTVILSNKSMIITGIQRNIKSEGKLESIIADILSSISPLALQIEEKIRKKEKKFKLKRIDNGILSGHIINIELAYEHHVIAEMASKNNYNINVDNNGKVEIWSDKSKGFPELETGGDKAIKNMDLLNENTKFLSRYKLEDINSEIKSEISNISNNLNKISELLYENAKHSTITQDQLDELISSQNRIDQILEKIIKNVF